MEAIILAGGLGTRLRGVIGDAPKCMAPVAGKPFLHYLFNYLDRQGATRVLLSLGHRHEAVLQWLEAQPYLPFEIDYVVENTPLGTGGGISLALDHCEAASTAVLNGDTMFDIDLRALLSAHTISGAETTIALKSLRDFDRYGIVETDNSGIVTAFHEKAPQAEGVINGGIYFIDRAAIAARGLPRKYSFEKDYLEHFVGEGIFHGQASDAYFIDIGVPEDYERAQTDFQKLFPQDA